MSKCPGKCYHMMNVFAGKQEDVDIWIRACKEEVSLLKEMINNPFLHISLDPSWRVEKVLLRSKLCLRSWFPLCSALQTAHEGISRCKGYNQKWYSKPFRLSSLWGTPRHGTPLSSPPSTRLVRIKYCEIDLTNMENAFSLLPSIASWKAPDCKVAGWTGILQKYWL